MIFVVGGLDVVCLGVGWGWGRLMVRGPGSLRIGTPLGRFFQFGHPLLPIGLRRVSAVMPLLVLPLYVRFFLGLVVQVEKYDEKRRLPLPQTPIDVC